MISVSDIVKLLEQIPVWKSVVQLPKRVADLERRLAEMEKAQGKGAARSWRNCTLCGASLTVVAERPHPIKHHFGDKQLDVKCDACGYTGTRDIDPSRD